MTYKFELVGNFVKVSDSVSLESIYYLPVNRILLTKINQNEFEFNLTGENIFQIINWRDVTVPDNTAYANIDLFLDALAVILNVVIGGAAGVNNYTGASPTTVTVGGLPAGSNISGLPISNILESILVTYIAPAFSSFTSSLFSTFEVGQTIPSGSQTVNYAVSNSNNIKTQPPNVGVPSTNIAGATFPVNPFALTGSGSFSITVPISITSSTPATMTVSCQGTNSLSATFSTVGNILFRQKVYWGQSSNASFVEADILSLISSQLRSSFAGTFPFPATGYKWFCYPATMGTATTFTDTNNGFPVAMYGVVQTISVTNAYGVTENYKAHRTLNMLGSSINIAIS